MNEDLFAATGATARITETRGPRATLGAREHAERHHDPAPNRHGGSTRRRLPVAELRESPGVPAYSRATHTAIANPSKPLAYPPSAPRAARIALIRRPSTPPAGA
jgi:hypothetical protein